MTTGDWVLTSRLPSALQFLQLPLSTHLSQPLLNIAVGNCAPYLVYLQHVSLTSRTCQSERHSTNLYLIPVAPSLVVRQKWATLSALGSGTKLYSNTSYSDNSGTFPCSSWKGCRNSWKCSWCIIQLQSRLYFVTKDIQMVFCKLILHAHLLELIKYSIGRMISTFNPLFNVYH